MGSDKEIIGEIDAAGIDRIVRAAMKAAKTPGVAVAVVVGDTPAYVQGYGVRELGGDDPVTTSTLFAIGSTTKAFTTTAMGILVDDKKMDWDDPVRKHLPGFRLSDPLADAHVTLRDLVCHRTGLPRHDMLWFGAPWGREEVLRRIGLAKSSASFRAKYQYQNICFLAAGEAVARAAGADSFEALTKARLLDPLGMARTNFSTTDAEAAPDHATGHRDVKNKRKPLPWRNLDNVGPCGSINSCAEDMARWLRFQLAGGVGPDGDRLISEASLRETHTPQMVEALDENFRAMYPDTVQMSYGLGWTVWDYRGGNGIVSHGGAIGGFRAHVALVPRAGIGIAILSNMQSFLPEMTRNALLDHLLGLPAHDWNRAFAKRLKTLEAEQAKREKERKEQRHKKTAPSLPLAAYVGEYEDPAYGTATVTKEKGNLHLSWSSWNARLRHHHHDLFVTTTDEPSFDDNEVLFSLSARGEVASLTLYDVPFPKMK